MVNISFTENKVEQTILNEIEGKLKINREITKADEVYFKRNGLIKWEEIGKLKLNFKVRFRFINNVLIKF